MRLRLSLVPFLTLVSACGARMWYSSDEVPIVSLGFHEHDVVVRYRLTSGDKIPRGVRVMKYGDGVSMEFVRSGYVDCEAKAPVGDESVVVVPYEITQDRMLYRREGEVFTSLGGARARE